MKRYVFFVDGFNLYHAITAQAALRPEFKKYKWLDLCALAGCYIPKSAELREVIYFTAYTTWNLEKWERHKIYVRAQESRGVRTVFGAFRAREKTCRNCGKTFQTFEEKQTDVNIAIELLRYAVEDRFDTAVIVSGDSDLIAALRSVRGIFPNKKIVVVIPIGRRAEELKSVADHHMKMKQKHLASSQLPDAIDLGGGVVLNRPTGWR